MGKTSEKLAYLNTTKRLMRRRINSLGGSITLNTKFRDYLNWLDRFYNAVASPIEIEILGETKQRAENTSANLLPLYSGEIVTDGVTITISEGGKITINGTATRDLWIKITNGIDVAYSNPYNDNSHSWWDETIKEFNPAETIYFQTGVGEVNETPSNSDKVSYVFYANNSKSYAQNGINTFEPSSFDEKHIRATVVKTNVNKLCWVHLYISAGHLIDTYGYVQASKTDENTWVANNDAAPPSPDNPKTIVNKSGTITYTASDGTTFPITLEDDYGYTFDLCGNPDPNGTPDRIYLSNGKFYLEKRMTSETYTGAWGDESWARYVNEDSYGGELQDGQQHETTYAISNYFENVSNENIVDCHTADTYLNEYQFSVVKNDRNIYLKYGDLQEEAGLDDDLDTTQLRTWLSTHNLIVQFEIEEEVWEIEDIWASGLNAQLQAILDHEVKLRIQDEIIGG